MAERIYKQTYYEAQGDAAHIFEAFTHRAAGAAPYVILLDGSFLATAESGAEIAEEIADTVRWFGWKFTRDPAGAMIYEEVRA